MPLCFYPIHQAQVQGIKIFTLKKKDSVLFLFIKTQRKRDSGWSRAGFVTFQEL